MQVDVVLHQLHYLLSWIDEVDGIDASSDADAAAAAAATSAYHSDAHGHHCDEHSADVSMSGWERGPAHGGEEPQGHRGQHAQNEGNSARGGQELEEGTEEQGHGEDATVAVAGPAAAVDEPGAEHGAEHGREHWSEHEVAEHDAAEHDAVQEEILRCLREASRAMGGHC